MAYTGHCEASEWAGEKTEALNALRNDTYGLYAGDVDKLRTRDDVGVEDGSRLTLLEKRHGRHGYHSCIVSTVQEGPNACRGSGRGRLLPRAGIGSSANKRQRCQRQGSCLRNYSIILFLSSYYCSIKVQLLSSMQRQVSLMLLAGIQIALSSSPQI